LDAVGPAFGYSTSPIIVPDYKPRRFFSYDIGWSYTHRRYKYALLLPQMENDVIRAYVESKGGTGCNLTGFRHSSIYTRPVFRMVMHLGQVMSTENSLLLSRSDVSYVLSSSAGLPIGKVEGTLRMVDIRGSIRVNLLRRWRDRFHWFIRGGLGWVYYRVEDVRLVSDSTINLGRTEWFHNPKRWLPWTWTPNSWAAGVGIELTLLNRKPIINDLGLRAEYILTVQRHLGSDTSLDGRGDVTVSRNEVQVGLVLSTGF
jgi:hypothetical protein